MEAAIPSAAEPQVTAFEARMKGGRVLVEDPNRFQELEQAGYGEVDGKRYVLKDYEALFLLYAEKLRLLDEEGAEVSFRALSEKAQRESSESWTRFMIYRDLRSRGYVVKEGFGFGTDFRVYERGGYEKKRAKYVIFCVNEGINVKVGELSKHVREIETMGKNAIAAVVERRGEVIYYKLTNMKFNENKKQETTLALKERK